MISFRYHLVSTVAVFLALGLGVLMGSTVIDQGLVRDLERRTAEAERRADEARDEAAAARRAATALQGFTDGIVPLVIDGRLEGQSVVLVTQEGSDAQAQEASTNAVEAAGAEVVGVISASQRMGLDAEEDRADLASLLGTPTEQDVVELSNQAAVALSERLATGAPADPADADVLQILLENGFLSSSQLSEADLPSIGGPEQVVVVTGGGADEPVRPPSDFLVPLVTDLADAEGTVAAVEPRQSAYEFVTLLRDDGDVAGSILTVDDADEAAGEVSLVIGLEQLIETGQPGHYGVKDGVELLPEPA